MGHATRQNLGFLVSAGSALEGALHGLQEASRGARSDLELLLVRDNSNAEVLVLDVQRLARGRLELETVEVGGHLAPHDDPAQTVPNAHPLACSERDELVTLARLLDLPVEEAVVEVLLLLQPPLRPPLLGLLPRFLVHAGGVEVDHHLSALWDIVTKACRVLERHVWEPERREVLPAHKLEDDRVQVHKLLPVLIGREPVGPDDAVQLLLELALGLRVVAQDVEQPLKGCGGCVNATRHNVPHYDLDVNVGEAELLLTDDHLVKEVAGLFRVQGRLVILDPLADVSVHPVRPVLHLRQHLWLARKRLYQRHVVTGVTRGDPLEDLLQAGTHVLIVGRELVAKAEVAHLPHVNVQTLPPDLPTHVALHTLPDATAHLEPAVPGGVDLLHDDGHRPLSLLLHRHTPQQGGTRLAPLDKVVLQRDTPALCDDRNRVRAEAPSEVVTVDLQGVVDGLPIREDHGVLRAEPEPHHRSVCLRKFCHHLVHTRKLSRRRQQVQVPEHRKGEGLGGAVLHLAEDEVQNCLRHSVEQNRDGDLLPHRQALVPLNDRHRSALFDGCPFFASYSNKVQK
eukprot:Hpha_TRINITY_DN15502_c0_g5::TRINITY_DN15502_c0_g5_i1::g.104925::m.104925